jgi:hypothetical protein
MREGWGLVRFFWHDKWSHKNILLFFEQDQEIGDALTLHVLIVGRYTPFSAQDVFIMTPFLRFLAHRLDPLFM